MGDYTPAGADNEAIRETRDYVKSLNESSIRLERWTAVLIGVTIVLAILTAILVWRTL